MDWVELIRASRLLASGQPSQEALRRAISTAYYAMFHALATSNANILVGQKTPSNQPDWTSTYRSLRHFRAENPLYGWPHLFSPLTRTVGGTFEFTFVLPKPANTGGGRPKNRQSAAPTRRSLTKSTNSPANGETPLQSSLPMGDVAEREASEPRIKPVAIRSKPRPRGNAKESDTSTTRTPLTAEQKRERNRQRATERRQRQRENGLCVSCPNKPIEGQTRCPECAERHRQHWQNWKPKRKGSRPRSEN